MADGPGGLNDYRLEMRDMEWDIERERMILPPQCWRCCCLLLLPPLPLFLLPLPMNGDDLNWTGFHQYCFFPYKFPRYFRIYLKQIELLRTATAPLYNWFSISSQKTRRNKEKTRRREKVKSVWKDVNKRRTIKARMVKETYSERCVFPFTLKRMIFFSENKKHRVYSYYNHENI